MRSIISIVCITFFLTVSCCKEEVSPILVDGEGVVVSIPYHWRFSLHESGQYYENGFFKSAIIYNENIAIPTTAKDGNQCISMINTSKGKLEWQWNEVYPGSLGSLDFYQHYICNNFLTWQVFSISLPISYCVNLENGSTHWRIQREKLFYVRLHPYLGSKYFTTSDIEREDGFNETAAYIGDIETGELSEFLRANYSGDYASPFTDNGWVGGIVHMNPLPSYDSLIVVTYAEPLPEWQIKSFIGLYNTEAEAWVYERKQLVEPHWNAGVQNTPIIYNERVYAAAGNSIVCHDVMTGDQLWRRNFEQDFLFSGFIIEDGMLLANCEDTYTYRLNPHTGATIWRTKGAGTCSRMSYLNGVVYFVGGSTGFLHALDAETGRVLWRIDARRLGEPNGNFTTNAVYCIPGEGGGRGRVVALTGRYAYCFEAAR